MEVGNAVERMEEGKYGRQEVVIQIAVQSPITNLHTYSSNNAEAVQFVTLFYTMLNACRSTEASADGGEFQARHFYDDCSLHLFYLTSEQRVEEYIGAQVVCHRLRTFVCQEQLQFNANTNSDATIGRSDPSGLIEILVCGTVLVGSLVWYATRVGLWTLTGALNSST